MQAALGDRAHIGAGTVLTPEEVRAVAATGASFIVSPNADHRVIARTKQLGLGSYPGVFTPTEAFAALAAGADALKIFPAAALGRDGLKALHEAHNAGIVTARLNKQPKGILAFLSRVTGIQTIIEKRQHKQDQQRAQEHKQQAQALQGRHHRELHEADRRARGWRRERPQSALDRRAVPSRGRRLRRPDRLCRRPRRQGETAGARTGMCLMIPMTCPRPPLPR